MSTIEEMSLEAVSLESTDEDNGNDDALLTGEASCCTFSELTKEATSVECLWLEHVTLSKTGENLEGDEQYECRLFWATTASPPAGCSPSWSADRLTIRVSTGWMIGVLVVAVVEAFAIEPLPTCSWSTSKDDDEIWHMVVVAVVAGGNESQVEFTKMMLSDPAEGEKFVPMLVFITGMLEAATDITQMLSLLVEVAIRDELWVEVGTCGSVVVIVVGGVDDFHDCGTFVFSVTKIAMSLIS